MQSEQSLKRRFILGEEWLYFKIYTGVKTAENILIDVIKPVSIFLLENNIIDSWFFIRYGDPDFHIRLRFHYTNPEKISSILLEMNKHMGKYIDEGAIWKVQVDTYQREIERYGSNTMILSEKLFYIDSNFIVNILPAFKNTKGENKRWIYGLKLTDVFLNQFEYSLEEKMNLMYSLKEGFGKEFGMNLFFKKQIDKIYRDERKQIENTLIIEQEEDSIISEFLEYIGKYAKFINPIVTKILELEKENLLQIKKENLVSSYIHMIMNRLFKTKHRLHELVLYDFLFRHYRSSIAKLQKK